MDARLFRLKLLTGVLVFMVALSSRAQTLFNGNSSITLAPNTTMSVIGDVENKGTLLNNGHLKISGPWLNAGSYVPGTGEITFNGNSASLPQIIHHHGQTFNKVTITGGKKIVISDLGIRTSIHFIDGIVEVSDDSKIILSQAVTISGASDSSHVHGLVYHRGSGAKLFPLGNGSIYLPVELPDIKDDSSFVGVRAFETDNEELLTPASLRSIYSKRYWYIDFRKGSPTSSPIVLPMRDTSWPVDAKDVVVAQSSATNADFRSIGGALIPGGSYEGKIKSELNVTLPFIALATTVRESALIVHNAISPNGDGLNDFIRIENIESYPNNRLVLFNRWGDKVFEIEGYDNDERVFNGRGNTGPASELVSGNYFYVLDIAGQPSLHGFIALKN